MAGLVAVALLPGGSAWADPAPPESSSAAEPLCVSGRPFAVSGGVSAVMADADITLPRPDAEEDNSVSPAPPAWTLGVSGQTSPIALRGERASLSLVRTRVAGSGWGIVTGANSAGASFAAIDADLRTRPDAAAAGAALLGYAGDTLGSGYGIYCGPDSENYLYGTAVSGATYGVVLDGAESLWLGSSAGTIPLYDANGGLTGVAAGQGQASTFDSVFGLLMLDGADCAVTVDEGTAIHTREAAVLCQGGIGTLRFNNARLDSDSGVLLQMMDSDADDRTDGAFYDERDVGGRTGFPGISYNDPWAAAAVPDSSDDPSLPPAENAEALTVSYTNGLYKGDLYNGTGWYGHPGDSLSVTVGRGAVLYGDAALASAVKAIPYRAEAAELLDRMEGVRYELLDQKGRTCGADEAALIQLTAYTAGQYYLQGHVRDLPCSNGRAALYMTVAENGVWLVRERSLVSTLTVEPGATVYGTVHRNADGTVIVLPAGEPLAPGVYGE